MDHGICEPIRRRHWARVCSVKHAGLGITGPPLRLGAAPEVVVLTLRRAR